MDTATPYTSTAFNPLLAPTMTDAMTLQMQMQSLAKQSNLMNIQQGHGFELMVRVEGLDYDYEFKEEDLENVFSRYGAVKEIKIQSNGKEGTVVFKDYWEAISAQASLDGYVLGKIQGRLAVRFALPDMTQLDVFPLWPTYLPPTQPMEETVGRKQTCRFDIPIESDSDFQVSRRIIGSKGTNMKHIVKQSDAKLRLRGKGSGYLEGPNKQESHEALHLCVSCTDEVGYKVAVREVKKLLQNVCQEYKEYLTEKGLPVPDLEIKMREMPPNAKRGTRSMSMCEAPSDSFKAEEVQVNRRRARTMTATELGDSEAIDELINKRNEARRQCNWSEADLIRDKLRKKGVAVMDEPGKRGSASDVTHWRYWRPNGSRMTNS